MSEVWILLTAFIGLHIGVVSFFLHDLIFVSKRGQKPLWGFFLMFIPFFSAIAYRQTMRRKRNNFL